MNRGVPEEPSAVSAPEVAITLTLAPSFLSLPGTAGSLCPPPTVTPLLFQWPLPCDPIRHLQALLPSS